MRGKILEYEAKTIFMEGVREGRLAAEREARLKGEREGQLELLAELVRDGILSISNAATRVEMSEEEFMAKMKEYEEK